MSKNVFARLICLVILIDCYQGYGKQPDNANQNINVLLDIQFEDLRDQYRIIGMLGKPIGEYHTIRGVWKNNNLSSKLKFFQLTHIDHQLLHDSIIYPEKQFIHFGNLGINSTEPHIEPSISATWECRVFEDLRFNGIPKMFWEEAGIPDRIATFSGKGKEGSTVFPFELRSYLSYHHEPLLLTKAGSVKEQNKITKKEVVIENSRSSIGGYKSVETQNENKIDINFYDLRDQYRVIGRLGKPLGDYSTIRGVWETAKRKYGKGEFVKFLYVTHVDDRVLKKRIPFDRSNIGALPSKTFEPPLQEPEESDVWELRVFETIKHFGRPKNYNTESLDQHVYPPIKLESYLIYHSRPQLINK